MARHITSKIVHECVYISCDRVTAINNLCIAVVSPAAVPGEP